MPTFSFEVKEIDLDSAYKMVQEKFLTEFSEINAAITTENSPKTFSGRTNWGTVNFELSTIEGGTRVNGNVSFPFSYLIGAVGISLVYAFVGARGSINYALGAWVGRRMAAAHNANLGPGELPWNPNMNYIEMYGNTSMDNANAFRLAFFFAFAITLPIAIIATWNKLNTQKTIGPRFSTSMNGINFQDKWVYEPIT